MSALPKKLSENKDSRIAITHSKTAILKQQEETIPTNSQKDNRDDFPGILLRAVSLPLTLICLIYGKLGHVQNSWPQSIENLQKRQKNESWKQTEKNPKQIREKKENMENSNLQWKLQDSCLVTLGSVCNMFHTAIVTRDTICGSPR